MSSLCCKHRAFVKDTLQLLIVLNARLVEPEEWTAELGCEYPFVPHGFFFFSFSSFFSYAWQAWDVVRTIWSDA